ncbi:hypothetical protein VOLCADRAFT_67408 [Volvox carteri f. nagariensis]|uniref:Alpha-1,3-glucosyltransferase n=1 Tax=Volvox carteri f. nagariensis TaxID=3068 RepID=D8UDK3_VOLCA|nr:uncharacterized protein VOLCADRAFT_67408 [Volvox carteri f. nagariensis]EFJ42208.1 hypothetical protein VOLCADRAFT_67408 [Volvox carteri f. nagariensis]|eukprot:XP_002956751.1 hypothetical protein VOLCADRAFT_67408 [Volvox carteri f. nagariensis]
MIVVCLQIAVIATACKLLLVPTYRSTDFEVHRNWLAITHNLPISKWYVEATSEWTLDYPPFFAWFEWLLSQFALFVDPAMLVVQNLEYASERTVLFQRASVIVTDLVLLAASYALARWEPRNSSGSDNVNMRRGAVLFFLVSCNAGLMLVDHVHFQYNGVMMGVLLWSLYAACRGRMLASGLLFAALLNMKHLFLYAAPAYFVVLLRHYCCEGTAIGGEERGAAGFGRIALRLAVLGSGVLAIFGASFGPFIVMGQMPQVLRRLFPFGRGLMHAYWAANAWAPYAAADKLLAVGLPRIAPWLGLDLERMGLRIQRGAANMAARTRSLPQVTPAATALAVLVGLLPCLAALWAGDGRPGYVRRNIFRAVSYSFLCGFVFGYHVHEKAVLVALLPLAVDAVVSPVAARRFLLLASAGHYGLLPLLFRPQEYGAKVLLVLSYFVVSAAALCGLHAEVQPSAGPPVKAYMVGFLLVELYVSVVHDAVPFLRRNLPFAPLMLTSVYCSVAVLAVWVDAAIEWARDVAAAAGW